MSLPWRFLFNFHASSMSLQWRHTGHDGVSNHQPHDCFLNRLFRHRSKKTSKLRVTGFVPGIHRKPVNSPHKWPVTWKMFPFDDVIMVLIGRPGILRGCACRVAQATAPPLWPATLPGRQARLDPSRWPCARKPGDPVTLKKLDSL